MYQGLFPLLLGNPGCLLSILGAPGGAFYLPWKRTVLGIKTVLFCGGQNGGLRSPPGAQITVPEENRVGYQNGSFWLKLKKHALGRALQPSPRPLVKWRGEFFLSSVQATSALRSSLTERPPQIGKMNFCSPKSKKTNPDFQEVGERRPPSCDRMKLCKAYRWSFIIHGPTRGVGAGTGGGTKPCCRSATNVACCAAESSM
jgi:hypothetical protein